MENGPFDFKIHFLLNMRNSIAMLVYQSVSTALWWSQESCNVVWYKTGDFSSLTFTAHHKNIMFHEIYLQYPHLFLITIYLVMCPFFFSFPKLPKNEGNLRDPYSPIS